MHKEAVKEVLISEIAKRIQVVQNQIDMLRNDMHAESKSTSGDKHETGRAMIQLEMENLGKQHQNWENMFLIAQAIDTKAHVVAKAGSILIINGMNYYLSVGFGKIDFEGEPIMCLAPSAPLAQLILGISAGSQITFNQRVLKIEAIF